MKGDASGKLAKFGLAIGGVKAGLDILVGAFKIVKSVVFDFTNDLAKRGDDIAKTANKIGLTTESLQELSFAAEISGADVTKVTKAVQTMAKGLNDARNKGTGPFQDSIDQLGISIQEFDGLSPDEIFERFATEIAKIEDPITQSALAADVFGRSGKELLPFFKLGAKGIRELRGEFKALGGGFTNDGAAAAEEFIDAQTRMGVVIDSIKIAIGTELFPVLQEIIDAIREWLQVNKDIIRGRIIKFINNLVDQVKRLAPVLLTVVELGERWLPILIDLAEAALEFFGSLDEGEAKVSLMAIAFVALGAAIGGIPGLVIAAGGAIGVFVGNALAEITGLNQEIRELNANLKRTKVRREVTEKGGKAAKVLDEASSEELAALSDTEFEELVTDALKAAAVTGPKALDIVNVVIAGAEGGRDFVIKRREAGTDLDFVKQQTLRATGGFKVKKPKAGKKAKEEEPLTDSELLQLIQKAGASGESLTGLIGDRKIPGGIPPVITITINNFEQDIEVAIENNVTGVPGTSAEEVAAITVEQSRDMLLDTFEDLKDTLAPPQAV